jgi:metal-responsive CopG/Arc/MetJ family transcriptional regulator
MALPYLNGHPSDDATDPAEPTERVWTTVPTSLVADINDFHYGRRLKNRSAAVAELIRLGLIQARGQGRN